MNLPKRIKALERRMERMEQRITMRPDLEGIDSEWIDRKMSEKKLSNKELAARTGLSQSEVSLFRSGKRTLSRAVKAAVWYALMY